MSLTVVILNNSEKFIKFLDTNLLTLTEEHEINNLRRIKLEYNITNLEDAQKLFCSGNKIWVQGDPNLTDCLYIINNNIEKDLFNENKITLEAEEILVELNYAPPFLQTEVTKSNGFNIIKQNSEDNVKVDYYSLNYWFGDYFKIGVVQECLSSHLSRIAPRGIMSKMELLRYIEEETGNVFRTHYEKDINNNIIHRYLDFLNPDNSNSDWELFFEYTIPEDDDETGILVDENGEEIGNEPLTADDELDGVIDEEDIVECPTNKEIIYYDLSELTFQLIDKKGKNIADCNWNGSDIGMINNQANLIRIAYNSNGLVCQCNGKIFANVNNNLIDVTEVYTIPDFTSIANDPNKVDVILPTHSILQILANGVIIYQQEINPLLGDTHKEVLDLGYNLKNIQYDIDESDTFNSIMPILSSSTKKDGNDLNKNDINRIINDWINLEISKGQLIPMIIQKVTTTGTKTENIINNYYSKPINPNNNPDNNKYEYWAAVAYRNAPFNKNAGEPFIYDDTITGIDYTHIKTRHDINETRGDSFSPKIGSVETSEEDKYAIYNIVAKKLNEKKHPKVSVVVDVANYKNRKFNDYQLWDKVYLKLPGYSELITARVEQVSKSSNNISENTVKLGNYSINTVIPQTATVIYGDNVNFVYPNKGKLTVELKDENDCRLGNKLLTFSSESNDSNASPNIVHNIITNSEGMASITLLHNPGNYTVSVHYGGDELYEPVTATFDVSIGGTLPEVKTTKKATKKTTRKTSRKKKKTKTIKTYWSKCGISPDKKKITAISQPSGHDSNKYKYNQLWETIFKNKCPECGRKGTLRFDGGKANKCITSAGAHGRGYKIGVPETEITCVHCDSDFCGVTGIEKDSKHSTRLTTLKKPKKSSKSRRAKLTKGKLLYNTKKVSVKKKKNNKVTTGRTNPIGNVSKKVKEKALKIVGKKKDLAAAKAIAAWMGAHIRYEKIPSKKNGFTRSPNNVLSSRMGNCCSQTRLMLQMMDAAGVTDKYKLYYIHVSTGSRGHVFARINKKGQKKGVYVDPVKKHPWRNYLRGWGKIGSCPNSKYPRLPF